MTSKAVQTLEEPGAAGERFYCIFFSHCDVISNFNDRRPWKIVVNWFSIITFTVFTYISFEIFSENCATITSFPWSVTLYYHQPYPSANQCATDRSVIE